jgi:chorismate dehydratase
MRPARLGAVSYLNTKPLVRGLEERPDLFTVRFDVPSVCASLLHEGAVDVGLIPAIEYLHGDYAIVPDIAIGSDGPVASVAVFTRAPIDRVRTLALDPSSRTSVALTRVLCAHRWGITPEFVAADGRAPATLADDEGARGRAVDAMLVIGDPALEVAEEFPALGKIDLGVEWQAMTGLPFVYAVWAGRPAALDHEQVVALQEARRRGEAEVAEIARETSEGRPGRERRNLEYLRDTLRYGLGEREIAGLKRFHALVVELGLAAAARPLTFFS